MKEFTIYRDFLSYSNSTHIRRIDDYLGIKKLAQAVIRTWVKDICEIASDYQKFPSGFKKEKLERELSWIDSPIAHFWCQVAGFSPERIKAAIKSKIHI